MSPVHPGQPITYHGSLTKHHGPAVLLGLCDCGARPCRDYIYAAPELWRYKIEVTGRRTVEHVRRGSFSPIEIPDTIGSIIAT